MGLTIKMFYAKLDSVLDQFLRQNKLILLGNFNAVTGTKRASYEMCVGLHEFGTRNSNSSLLLNFAKTQKVENSRFLVSETRAAPLDLV